MACCGVGELPSLRELGRPLGAAAGGLAGWTLARPADKFGAAVVGAALGWFLLGLAGGSGSGRVPLPGPGPGAGGEDADGLELELGYRAVCDPASPLYSPPDCS